MNPKEYQSLASRTECDQKAASMRRLFADVESSNLLVATRLTHGALGLTGEVGELAYAVEKWIHYGKPLDIVNIKEEVGDCLWYLALVCNAVGIDLGESMEANINKLKVRYPEKYSDEKASEENRDRELERRELTNVPPEDRSESSERTYLLSLSDDYPTYCLICGLVPVSKLCRSGFCSDCAAAQRAVDKRQETVKIKSGDLHNTG